MDSSQRLKSLLMLEPMAKLEYNIVMNKLHFTWRSFKAIHTLWLCWIQLVLTLKLKRAMAIPPYSLPFFRGYESMTRDEEERRRLWEGLA